MAKPDTLLSFPCSYTIKIIGINNERFIAEVVAIIASLSNSFNPETDVVVKPSNKDNYLSVSAAIEAHSQEQLDQIYQTLNNNKLVKLTL